jgi:LysR family hydrogen peroxide-inducible transcriptional activator
MTLTELRYIVTLAEEQHFGRAAERCHVSQPTLSIAVKKLEEELGVALFERAKTRVHATAVGEQVLVRARRMLEQAAEIRDLAGADRDQLGGPLAVGALSTIGPYLLPQLIPLLQKMAPLMPLYVEEDTVPALAKKLRHGELDALILTQPFAEPDVVVQMLYEEPFVLLLPANHRLVHQAELRVQDLPVEELLLLGEGSPFRDQVLAALPGLNLTSVQPARPVSQNTTLETLRHMVASGLGITILPQSAAQSPLYAPNLLVVRPFVNPVPRRTLVLAWRASYPRHKAVDVLRRAIVSASAAYWNFSTSRQEDASGLLVENRDW